MEIKEVVPRKDFKVYVRYNNGKIKLYDAKPLLEGYPILQNIDFFINRCTIINDTLAWDVTGDMDDTMCIDIAPEAICASKDVLKIY